jgi:glycosyltransferase involved in cell wall biosynthesis
MRYKPLVPPRAPRVLAAKILDMLRDRETAQEMARRAAAAVRQELGLTTIVTRYTALYAELLDGSGRGRFHTTGAIRYRSSAVREW